MDINFKSFSLSPSDHECQEGDLASVGNLVNEDGALKPIPQPERLANIQLPDGYSVEDTKFYIHEVDNDDPESDDHRNYIAVVSGALGDHVFWCDDTETEDPVWQEIEVLDGFKVNSITPTGRILSLLGDKEQLWLCWKGDSYDVIIKDYFRYRVKVWSDIHKEDYHGEPKIKYKHNFGNDFEGLLQLSDAIPPTVPEHNLYSGISRIGMKAIMEGIDAELNKDLENDPYLHKHLAFGFVALRMYDGSYISYSDLFVLSGSVGLSKFDIEIKKNTDDIMEMSVSCDTCLHKHNIGILMADSNNFSKVKPLIQGFDVFLSTPDVFVDYAVPYKFPTPIRPFRKYDPEEFSGTYRVPALERSELYRQIDNLSFHRSIFIDVEDIEKWNGYHYFQLKNIDATDRTTTLSEYANSVYGGNVAMSYNGRVCIGDVTEVNKFNKPCSITYLFAPTFAGNPDEESPQHIVWNNIPTNAQYRESEELYYPDLISPFAKASIIDSYGSEKNIYLRKGEYSLYTPIVVLQKQDVRDMNVVCNVIDLTYRKTKSSLKFHTSETGSFSYYINIEQGRIALINSNSSILENISEEEFQASITEFQKHPQELITRHRNCIMYSVADNPFIIYSRSLVTVGNGTIISLAAPTQPISQGQAGQTPLIAFTSEGIWPLYVNQQDGSLGATQPGPRDILINPESVTSIDDAIVFATARGLMIYAGSQTKCITDTLRGHVFGNDLPNLDDIMEAALGSSSGDSLKRYAPLVNLESFLKDCKILYDYIDQRLLIYSPNDDNVLVYSLRSGAWGATSYDYRKNLNSYPDALAIGKEAGNYYIVNAHNSTPAGSVIPFHLVTRPMGLGEPDALKRISTAIVRGMFQKGHVKTAIYGSRDMYNWFLLNTSVDQYLRGRMGTPYKYFRIVAAGQLDPDESIYGVSMDVSGSLTNQMR